MLWVEDSQSRYITSENSTERKKICMIFLDNKSLEEEVYVYEPIDEQEIYDLESDIESICEVVWDMEQTQKLIFILDISSFHDESRIRCRLWFLLNQQIRY